jgi:HEAT repeat protein
MDVQDLVRRLAQQGPANAAQRQAAVEALMRLGTSARPAAAKVLLATMDPDATVRKAAATALRHIDPDWPRNTDVVATVPSLIQQLGSDVVEAGQMAVVLLGHIGAPAVPHLADALADPKNERRPLNAARALARMGPAAAAAVPALIQALHSSFTHLREAAAQALGAIGPDAAPAVGALVSLLADWAPMVRQAAARSLARVGPAAHEAIPALVQLLPDREEGVRDAAVEALAEAGPATVPMLIDFLQAHDFHDMQEWLRLRSLALATLTQDTEWRNAAWAFAYAVDDQMRLEVAREAVVRVFGKIGPAAAAAVPTLVECLGDKDRRVRLAAARSLGQVGPGAEVALEAVVKALADLAEPVRKTAAEALQRIDARWTASPRVRGALDGLVEALKRTGEDGQLAADVLVLIGPPCVPLLIQAVASPDRIQREAAATTLGRIGPAAAEAIPALVQAEQDSHGWVRAAATKALEQVGPQKARLQGAG